MTPSEKEPAEPEKPAPEKSEGQARREQTAGLGEIAEIVQIGSVWG